MITLVVLVLGALLLMPLASHSFTAGRVRLELHGPVGADPGLASAPDRAP